MFRQLQHQRAIQVCATHTNTFCRAFDDLSGLRGAGFLADFFVGGCFSTESAGPAHEHDNTSYESYESCVDERK